MSKLWAYSRERSYVRFMGPTATAESGASGGTMSFMGYTATLTLSSGSKSSGFVGLVMSSVWRSLLRLVRYLSQNRVVAVAEEEDRTYVGATRC